MTNVEFLTTIIADRDFEVRNLRAKHSPDKIVGYSFDLYFESGEVNNYSTGLLEDDDLKAVTEWLWRNV